MVFKQAEFQNFFLMCCPDKQTIKEIDGLVDEPAKKRTRHVLFPGLIYDTGPAG